MSIQTTINKNKDIFSDEPEMEYSLLNPYDERKKIGQLFTPFPIAEFMSEWIIGNVNCETILDPAVGLGIFFRAIVLKKGCERYRFIGYDIDEKILNCAKDIIDNIPDIKVNLEKKNYLTIGRTNMMVLVAILRI